MQTPKTNMQDLLNANGSNPEAQQEYIKNTTYKQQVVDIDVNFSNGTIPITADIHAQAKLAVEERIKATRPYTKKRLDNIDKNIKQYYSMPGVADDGKSLATVFFPETFNAVEDWSDDLYLMFDNMIDDLTLEEVGDNIESFITKTLDITEADDDKQMGMMRSFTKFLFLKDNAGDKDNYHFKKEEIIKSFLKRGLHKSGYREKIEQFFTNGINSGMFVLKDNWGPTGEYKITSSKNGEKEYVLDQEDVYRFTPVDSRLLIFPKHGMPWCTEKINTTFHDLLNTVFDCDGKPVDNPKYDIKMLKIIGDHLRSVGASTAKIKDHAIEVSEEDMTDDDLNNLWDIDGDVTVYESHSIPLLVKKDGNTRPYKFLISQINISGSEEEENLITIGVQKTPFVVGVPYMYENFVKKDGDIAGMGLPELVRPLQKMLNNFAGHAVDILNLALWGIMVVDADSFKDPSKLKEITPRLILKLKNMKGRNLSEAVQWMHPRLDTLSSMGDLFSLFQQALKQTTRKGPTGEKVAPNPSATEFDTMMTELQKSVNKVGLRINNLFGEMLKRMYIYNIMNLQGTLVMRAQAYRIVDKKDKRAVLKQLEQDVESTPQEKYMMSDKKIELTPEELFIDGLNFNLKAADTFNKKATAKQQAMQMTKTLVDSGFITGPDGQQKIMIDETGAQVYISEYKLARNLLDIFDYEDLFEKVEADNESTNSIPQEGAAPPPTQTAPSPSTPNLTASPETGNILQQANTMSQGVNV